MFERKIILSYQLQELMNLSKKIKKVKRKIIRIDEELCTGCGKCVISCAEGALAIIDGKAKVISEILCDGLGACIGECPEGALKIEERDALEFNEEIVEMHLEKLKNEGKSELLEDFVQETTIKNEKMQDSSGFCCISSETIVFDEKWTDSDDVNEIKSALRQWPVKLTLVNPKAPYFNNRELIIASDCSPFIYGEFHRKILRSRPIISTCPMLSINESELNKLEEILRYNPIEKLIIFLVDVGCCLKFKFYLDPILNDIKRIIEINEVVINRRGKIIKNEILN